MTDHLTVASYNIHRCVGADGRKDPHRIARVIQSLDAGVVGLQEVECVTACRTHQAEIIAEATHLTPVLGPTMRRRDKVYGNVLLTAYPVVGIRTVDLSLPGRETRGAIDADLNIGGITVRVLVTHLGLRARERRYQVTRILEELEQNGGGLLVLLGDINEWMPLSPALCALHKRLGKAPAAPTFPSRSPFMALDRIWVCPVEKLLSLEVCNGALARIASDHLPVKANIAPPNMDG
jgi:endonuclease/exonuclease/phosphatase family metal-dependent hydrolase